MYDSHGFGHEADGEYERALSLGLEPTLPRYNRSVRAYAAALTEPQAST